MLRWILLVGLCVGGLGCGSGEKSLLVRKPCVPVTGKLVYSNQQPIAGALVVFHQANPPEEGADYSASATTEADGTFKLTTYVVGDGLPVGEYIVTVQVNQRAKPAGDGQRETEYDPDKDPAAGKALPPEPYQGKFSTLNSPLRRTITTSTREVEPLVLGPN
jgi:hypothetical protein